MFLDLKCSVANNPNLPVNQIEFFTNLFKDFAKTAVVHFDAHFCDKPVAHPIQKFPPSRLSRDAASNSYANVASRTSVNRIAYGPPPNAPAPVNRKPQQKFPRPDDRLFVRVLVGEKLRDYSVYPIKIHFKSRLGKDGKFLRNMQHTRIGFELFSRDGESATLKEKITADSFFGGVPVKNASPCIYFRIKNLPRSYCTMKRSGEEWKFCLKKVSEAVFHDAL